MEEYIDLIKQQSSIHVLQRVSDINTIYFNSIHSRHKISDPNFETSSEEDQYVRKFVTYDNNKDACLEDQSIDNWPFASLRPIVGNLFTRDVAIGARVSRMRDIIIGPCSLYLAVQANVNMFTYKRTEFSEPRLTNVDVYEGLFDETQTNTDDDDEYSDDSRRHKLKITIHVVDHNSDKDEKIGNLATAIDRSDIIMISIRRASLGRPTQDADGSNEAIRDQAGDNLIRVEFQILAEFFPNSLVGQAFDSGRYDYYSNPFMQPIGIGCYNKESADVYGGLVNEFKIPSPQMSAEYYSTSGSEGISYVAFDGLNHILRLDRNGRKSLYDLERRRSYHVPEYIARDDPNESLIVENKPTCCVLDIQDKSLHTNAFERLIGLSDDEAAQYMGSRLIESISYQVYEAEVLYKGRDRGYNLPILLESTRFSMPFEQNDKRYFVTYYMHHSKDIYGRLNRSHDAEVDQDTRVLVPYFIELWELSTWTKKRALINRVEFAQFSWTLDVQPSNDPAAQDLSDVFSVGECLKDVSSRADLSFLIREVNHTHQPRLPDQISSLRSNSRLISQVVRGNLARALEISPLNVAQLQVVARDTSDILVDAKISELITCLKSFDHIGDISISDRRVQRIRAHQNRHSIDECKLDSISEPSDHWAAYCPNKAECVIMGKTNDLYAAMEDRRRSSINSQHEDSFVGAEDDLCSVFLFGCIPYFNKDDEVYARVRDNLHKLTEHGVAFDLPVKGHNTNKSRWLQYSGVGYAPQLHRLESAGASLRHLDAANAVKGLRYATEGAPDAININTRVEFASSDGMFRRCYIACHMDSLCASFSYCIRPKQYKRLDDCVLSSIRLTRERLDSLISHITSDSKEGDEFNLTMHRGNESLTMTMKRDAACNIHPKDYLSEYKIIKSYKPARSELSSVRESAGTKTEVGTTGGRHLSLDGCAGLSYERNLRSDPIDSNFTYCSITSECFMSDDKGLKEAISSESDRHCYVFKRSHSTNYGRQMMHSMSLLVEPNSNAVAGSNGERRYDEAKDKLKVVRHFEGLAAEQCARDCNLRKSNCLAFDFCRAKTMTCVLYSIRSPMSGSNISYPMSIIEGRFQSIGGYVRLQDAPNCAHYFLKDDHLEIKLQQIESYLEKQGTGTSLGDKILEEHLADTETRVLDGDQRRKSELSAALDRSDGDSDGERSTGEFSIPSIIVGLLIGALVIYGQETLKTSTGLYNAINHKLRHIKARESDQQMIMELETYPVPNKASSLINVS